ncbi:sentrin-specific protease 1-like [Siphateles boraxobius]|uniref:sentrin-specific protease 1-like n=1 Tax=Siphateles boraxobius TaxID=180520 RepID=UPI0040644DE6
MGERQCSLQRFLLKCHGSTESNSSCKMPPCTVAPLSTPHSVTKVNDSEKLQDSALQRPSVIQVAPKMLDQTNGYIKELKLTPTDEEPAIKFPSDVNQISEEQVMKVWAANVTGQVEAVVGPYKLYDSSFHSLQGAEWLADEVIDAYLHLVVEKQQNHIHQLCAVVARSLFAGQFRCLGKMKFPIEDIWLCPVNVGAHWILVIINMPEKTLLVIDPMGNERSYEHKILRNWRNFLKLRCDEQTAQWQLRTLKHDLQMDSSSCGVLVLNFAEQYLLTGTISNVQTTPEAVSSARMKVACTLLGCRGNAEEYCVLCSMLEDDPNESMIEMVQCESCNRWAHFKCCNSVA